MIYTIYRKQQLNCGIEEAWKFFSSANNLSIITPPDMNFTVLTKMENDEIFEGMIIDYYVSPILGIKMKWKTEITQVKFGNSFTDFQKEGPYKLWNHRHEFIANDKGVFMKDLVKYELPFGFLGDLAHKLFVRKKIEHIFNYRYNILEELFNKNTKS
ncbi:hypothetical protein D1631_14130 [Chryseobacterium nematophagum]|uniref:Cell division inhibitor n=2 Tax=Chryseobacterium TaxID=59732 RepID=A0A3M7TI70_9FLAO|nr:MULTISPECIES: SRPBCC family protein [Chryseobacterium]AZA92812.1 hypothetical protein EG343_20545 [Chryseobacterium nakagawai]RNA62988.1 hypothetical protein D1631_14130 [Chryseobacterium nematophagum]VEH19421.1 Uncharacterized conserved protein [Chryseobacterium nakagawai]